MMYFSPYNPITKSEYFVTYEGNNSPIFAMKS
jgi:hypothetical protein